MRKNQNNKPLKENMNNNQSGLNQINKLSNKKQNNPNNPSKMNKINKHRNQNQNNNYPKRQKNEYVGGKALNSTQTELPFFRVFNKIFDFQTIFQIVFLLINVV